MLPKKYLPDVGRTSSEGCLSSDCYVDITIGHIQTGRNVTQPAEEQGLLATQTCPQIQGQILDV